MDTSQVAANSSTPPCYSEQVDALSQELMGAIADKWTLIVLETLRDNGTLRFTALRKAVPGISQKMLTQTLRQMERNGLLTRTIYPVIPPRVEYQRTELGQSLGRAICGLWTWVEDNADTLVAARNMFDKEKVGVE